MKVVDDLCTPEISICTRSQFAKSFDVAHSCVTSELCTALSPSVLLCRTALPTPQGQTVRGAQMASSTATPLGNHFSASSALVTTPHQPRKPVQTDALRPYIIILALAI